MGKPISGNTAQAPISLSGGKRQQSLSMVSLQFEQLGQLGSIDCGKRTSVSALNSPKVIDKSLSSFLGARQGLWRKPSSLSGTEEFLKGLELDGGASSTDQDMKFPSLHIFRESPKAKVSSSSPSKLRKDADAKIGGPHFHSSTMLERSSSMSRIAQQDKADVEKRRHSGPLSVEELILSGKLQRGSLSLQLDSQLTPSNELQKSRAVDGGNEGRSDALAVDIDEPTISLTTNASSPQTLKDEGEANQSTSAVEDALTCSEDASRISSTHSLSAVDDTEGKPIIERDSSDQEVSSLTKEPSSLATHSPQSLTWPEEDYQPCDITSKSKFLPSIASPALGSFHFEPGKIILPQEFDSHDCSATSTNKTVAENCTIKGIRSSPLFVSGKVTEEELTEAAVLSSLMSEDSMNNEGKNILLESPSTFNETDSEMTCKSDDCLANSSFETIVGGKSDRAQLKLKRKRRRSVSASGFGAMLLKVVRVADSGSVVMKRMPTGGPEMMSRVDASRARKFVLQKTAQFTVGPAPAGSFSSASAHDGVDGMGEFVINTEAETQSEKVGFSVVQSVELKSGTQFEHINGDEDLKQLDLSPAEVTLGLQVATTRETGSIDHQAKPQHLSEISSRQLLGLGNKIAENTCTHEEPTPTLTKVESCAQELVEQVDSKFPRPTAGGKSDSQTKSGIETGVDTNISMNNAAGNNEDGRHGGGSGARKKSSSRGRNSYDLDSLAGCLQATNGSMGALEQAPTRTINRTPITRERSRSFVSRLQTPSGALPFVDVYPVTSSVSILANPSYSSSQCQDRIWEEQAEIYSSGGRGTPGREDETTTPNCMLHSPSPRAGAISSEDHQVPSASVSLRRGPSHSTGRLPSTILGAKEAQQKGKKRGRSPRTPLQSLLGDGAHSKAAAAAAAAEPGCAMRSPRSPTGAHFIQQIMSRIRGNSPKSCSSSSLQPAIAKRRNTWSSCICFSIK
ncbi:uncharacterized protein [Physcomitrium patens]|uniref:Uncharacterized protein n=1 Tax=Physcomitrium patens TaxID=3218 RepID=A0A2K1L9S3_PHYPA|nr:uncharacterized protein LOC112279675 isoform X2 [Physcomitrium patens]PNR62775.1 hypothetical protein PHYPA_001199 [Physcomitrium patens]|eukprot:XP_024370129.1 uncharacterized protein LOC112279675 isoform X2 [Physcomitrella patens]